MIKKFTRIVLTAVMPIGIIAGCATAEKVKQKSRAVQSEKRLYGLLIWK